MVRRERITGFYSVMTCNDLSWSLPDPTGCSLPRRFRKMLNGIENPLVVFIGCCQGLIPHSVAKSWVLNAAFLEPTHCLKWFKMFILLVSKRHCYDLTHRRIAMLSCCWVVAVADITSASFSTLFTMVSESWEKCQTKNLANLKYPFSDSNFAKRNPRTVRGTSACDLWGHSIDFAPSKSSLKMS